MKLKKLNLFKVFDLKHKFDLLIAFGTGTVVGFSAGIASKVLDRLLAGESKTDCNSEQAGISRQKAEKLKEELDNTPVVPV
ncbi:MAG TPA: hypothetical protein PKC98_01540 [Candidatus Melainabacteria bacterium]|nr:hypothetical protein [Candidatus Melainabacteria bacterium]